MTTATLDHMIAELDRDDMLAVTRYVTFLFESRKKKVSDKKAALKKLSAHQGILRNSDTDMLRSDAMEKKYGRFS